MGLVLLRGNDGEYRRAWYAVMSINGIRTSRALKTPLRGKIPLDASGKFSLSLTGNKSFEESKAAAIAELQTELSDRKAKGVESRRRAEEMGVKRIRLINLADENAKRKKYELVEGSKKFKYNQSVYDILAHFAKWTAGRPKKRNAKRYALLSDIDSEIVKAYYAEISKTQSWQTFRKYVFILKSIFRHFTRGAIANPFETEYSEYKGKKSEFGDKSEVSHKPPSGEQMRRAWSYAGSIADKPYLRRLAVIAACTGLRIGDCCNLTWDKIDLLHGVIRGIKTTKTGAVVSIPIFDYDPASPDYNPIFGELRKELEAALAESDEGEKFVIPAAAHIYSYNPSRIYEEGKVIFAHAIAADSIPETVAAIGEEPPRKKPSEVLKLISKANFAPAKRDRISRVYELYTMGKSYAKIADEIGKRKSAVSEDLATVEMLTGEKIRKGINLPSTSTTLLKATRQERGQGQRAACLYGWHSCRMFFVGYAFYEIGMSEIDLIKITGHATMKMLRHYIETSDNSAVLAAKRKNAERNRAGISGSRAAAHLVGIGSEQPAALLPQPKSKADRLKEAKQLFDNALITEAEYNEARKKIINEL